MDPVKVQFKRFLKTLESYSGNHTSMITLLIPPKKEIHQVNSILVNEYGTASNIKNRVNRLSVLSAITSAQQKLKLYSRVPNNGLCLLVGTVSEAEGISKQVCYDFEPMKPIGHFIYTCDSKFHLETLHELLVDSKVYGFLVMNGDELLLAKISGNEQVICHHEQVTIPKKHGRGGQSALRFERHRTEAIHNYLRKISEAMVRNFITNDLPNINGLVLAGSADLKTEMSRSDLFDPRLRNVLLKILDVSYGGKPGLQEAIEASAEVLQEVEYIQEKKLLQEFFDLIATGSNLVIFGPTQTSDALKEGLLERVYLNQDHVDLDEIINIAVEKGTKTVVISGNTSEGTQFIKGFGGLAGISRYDLGYVEDELEWED